MPAYYVYIVVVEMNIIKQKRKELGLSQKELSEKLGTSQQTISRIEQGDTISIPCNLLQKLSHFFHVPIDLLVYGEQSSFYDEQTEELWKIYCDLDVVNKETWIMIGRRLSETQGEDKE